MSAIAAACKKDAAVAVAVAVAEPEAEAVAPKIEGALTVAVVAGAGIVVAAGLYSQDVEQMWARGKIARACCDSVSMYSLTAPFQWSLTSGGKSCCILAWYSAWETR